MNNYNYTKKKFDFEIRFGNEIFKPDCKKWHERLSKIGRSVYHNTSFDLTFVSMSLTDRNNKIAPIFNDFYIFDKTTFLVGRFPNKLVYSQISPNDPPDFEFDDEASISYKVIPYSQIKYFARTSWEKETTHFPPRSDMLIKTNIGDFTLYANRDERLGLNEHLDFLQLQEIERHLVSKL